jgi:hypothetical protein
MRFLGGLIVIALASRSWAFRTIWPFDVHRLISKDGIANEFTDQSSLKRLLSEIDNTDINRIKRDDNALHFDSEAFSQSTQRLAENLNAAMTLLSECKKSQAIEIGEACRSAVRSIYTTESK